MNAASLMRQPAPQPQQFPPFDPPMTSFAISPDVRQQVLAAFAELSAPLDDSGALLETILVRDGSYYGRCFRHADLIATLVAETGKLIITGEDGSLLHTVEMTPAAQHDADLAQAA